MTSPAASLSAEAGLAIEDLVARSVTGRRWVMTQADERAALTLSQGLGLPEIVARVLAARGIEIDDAEAFLNPTLKDLLPDPSRLLDMDKAADRIADALIHNEKIALFADYDVDGATSSAVTARFLRDAGAEPRVYIPDRMTEGYGPSAEAMQTLADEGAKLVILLDCGTTSFDALGAAKEIGLEVIVIDHHTAEPRLPDVLAMVNPNRLDADGKYGTLCTAGLAFLLVVAVNRVLRELGHWTETRPEPVLTRLLDLVALGTVCDVVKLEGLNRAFVTQGLKVMAKRGNTGLVALGDVAGVNEMPQSYHLGFVLGPRINAGGRIGKSDLGATLLRTEDAAEANAIAAKLDILNAERRDIEANVFEQALQQIERTGDPGAAVVVAGEGWHQGVVGIVASRLVERYARPACVIALNGATGTGSGRSVPGVDLGAAIIAARQKLLLIKGGGHAMAGGFTVAADQLQAFAAFIADRVAQQVGAGGPKPTFKIDGTLSVRGVSIELAEEIARLAPFGPGNPEPRFAVMDVRLAFSDIVGKDHVRCTFNAGAGSGSLDGIAFRAMGTPLGQLLMQAKDQTMHVAGRIKADTWQGRTRVKLHIEDAARA